MGRESKPIKHSTNVDGFEQYLIEFDTYPTVAMAFRRDIKLVPIGTVIDRDIIEQWEMDKAERLHPTKLRKAGLGPIAIIVRSRVCKLSEWKAVEHSDKWVY